MKIFEEVISKIMADAGIDAKVEVVAVPEGKTIEDVMRARGYHPEGKACEGCGQVHGYMNDEGSIIGAFEDKDHPVDDAKVKAKQRTEATREKALQAVRRRMANTLETYEVLKKLEASISLPDEKRTAMALLQEILLIKKLEELH